MCHAKPTNNRPHRSTAERRCCSGGATRRCCGRRPVQPAAPLARRTCGKTGRRCQKHREEQVPRHGSRLNYPEPLMTGRLQRGGRCKHVDHASSERVQGARAACSRAGRCGPGGVWSGAGRGPCRTWRSTVQPPASSGQLWNACRGARGANTLGGDSSAAQRGQQLPPMPPPLNPWSLARCPSPPALSCSFSKASYLTVSPGRCLGRAPGLCWRV